MPMDNRRKKFTFNEAVEYLLEAKVISDRVMDIGSNRQQTSLDLLTYIDLGIDKRPNGFFHRDDLNKLIGWCQMAKRDACR
jgi:hypothetical protein